ncbi:MAG: T9SS type A sorting domain-containing protein [Paludibacter sp.]|nr:T9SS type A sorting domain-containing protein [Paludibacter sp.]
MRKIIATLQKNSFKLSLLCFFLVSFYSYGAYTIESSSYLGGSGTTDRVYGSAILNDGTIVLAACITDANPGNVTPILLNGATASSSGAIVRLSSDGRTVLSVTRVADQVTDLSIDSQDRLYVAAMGGGALILNKTASTLLWSNTFSKSVQRIDASPSGRFAVLISNTTFLNKTVTSGEVYNYDNTFDLVGNWSTGMQYSLDVCIDETSETVISIGFKNITAADQSGSNPVDVSIYKGWSYTGTQKYKAYDWNGTRDDPRWINLPENNMADSRGARCEMGEDGKLYMTFAVDGGNHIFRYSPFNISTRSSIVGGDKYHAFYNTKTEKKTFFGRYNANDGTYIKGQQFCARLSAGAGSTAHPEFGDIHADADGRVYVIGTSASGLPLSMEPITGGYTGGAFVLIMNPDFTTRELCTRTAISGEGNTIAARNGKVVIGGYIATTQILYTTAAIDNIANGNDGFFSVFSNGNVNTGSSVNITSPGNESIIYPSITSGKLTIENASNSIVRIYNMNGKLVESFSVIGSPEIITINGVPGIYNLIICKENGVIETHTILKQ